MNNLLLYDYMVVKLLMKSLFRHVVSQSMTNVRLVRKCLPNSVERGGQTQTGFNFIQHLQ